MGGKASLLLVVGFSAIFLIFGNNYNTISSKAADNYFDYYLDITAHNIAVSGANMAARELFSNDKWVDGYSNLQLSGGLLNVSINNPFYEGNDKVKICHIPPGNPSNRHTIMVSQSAVAAHLAHGDTMGDCGDTVANQNQIITIVSEGKVFGLNNEEITSTVVVRIQPSSFSKFAYFSHSEGSNIWWTNKDTVWGPMHTNDYLRAYRHPVFYDKVTTRKRILYYSRHSYDYPIIHGDYQKGVYIPIPSDGVDKVEDQANLNGHVFSGHDDVYLLFDGDSIKYKFAEGDEYNAVLGANLTSNGIIFAQNANMHVEGTVKGRYTISVSGSGSKGSVYIDNNIVYNTSPMDNPESTDMLGIVSEKNVWISDNNANNSGDIEIHASIYCQEGKFGAENYRYRPRAGNINLVGGIIQDTRGAVGTFGNSGGSGFGKRYRYDNRLLYVSPPAFPGTGKFEILSWYE
ncbi:MAG: hypothetical protein ACEPO8_00355 [Rhodothermaceae bacterium]